MYYYTKLNGEVVSLEYEKILKLMKEYPNLEKLAINIGWTMVETRNLIEDIKKSGDGEYYLENQYIAWTDEEEKKLISEISKGLKIKEISRLHGRSIGAIRSRIKKIENRQNNN